VFSAGIGAHSPDVRSKICEQLEHLGVQLDARRNAAGEAVISSDASPATVRVINTDEEAFIAREVQRVLVRQ
jgi:acetate kinase